MNDFTHLHVHTEYSVNDALSKIDPLLDRAIELGQKAIAITDHGNLFGVVNFFKKAKEKGIKPIIGCEMYICPDGKEVQVRDNRHIVLLAKNEIGWNNLKDLMSEAAVDGGFYYNARTDYDSLRQKHEGLICLTACLGGDVPKTIELEGYEKGKEKLLLYEEIFGKENLFIELQDNGIEEQYKMNEILIQMSKETGIELVATNDVHYVKHEDYFYHDMLMAIQAKTTIDDTKRKIYGSDQFFLKSYDEMNTDKIPIEALENTNKIADMCNFEFEMGKYHIPKFEQPAEFSTSEEYLRYLGYKGMKERFAGVYGVDMQFTKEHDERLEYELSVISKMGYNDYFLIVFDFEDYAHKIGALSGPGRGSGAGSLLAFTLYITDIDPIPHNYIFERFLNPSRVSMPDIDWDIQSDRREDMINYVIKKYGRECVSQIMTLNRYKARGAVRAVCRALGKQYSVGDKIAKMIPMGVSIDDAFDINKDLEKLYQEDEEAKQVLEAALAIEGLPSSTGTHAAGVLITPEPVRNFVPLWKNKDTVVAQFDMGILEELGLLKMDFLGLKTLGVIQMTVRHIEKNYGVNITKEQLLNACEQPETFDLVCKGLTQGVFQFEGAGMTGFVKDLQPRTMEELTAANALYRPGPMAYIPQFIYNKNHQDEVEYPFGGDSKEVLVETYGILCYQEQVMRIARKIAGFSMSDADFLRKAIGKKKAKLIAEFREYFIYGKKDKDGNVVIPGGVALGYDEKELSDYYDYKIVPFGKYAFNKPHAGSYVVVACQTSWLKYHYPAEYMASLMTFVSDNPVTVSFYVKHCINDLKINVLHPHINISDSVFVPTKDREIIFGLSAINGVGDKAAEAIVTEREKNGLYKNFTDFVYRMIDYSNVNKKTIESLIKVGAINFEDVTRTQMIYIIEDMLNARKKLKKKLESNKEIELPNENEDLPNFIEYPDKVLLAMEKSLIGFYLSGHPLDKLGWYIEKYQTISASNLVDNTEENEEKEESENNFAIQKKEDIVLYDNKPVTIIGVVTEVRKTITKKKKEPMAFLTIEDLTGTTRVTVFPRTYDEMKDLCVEDKILHIDGVLNLYEGKFSIIANQIKEVVEDKISFVHIDINNHKDISKLLTLLSNNTGKYVTRINRGKWSAMLPKQYWINKSGIQSLKDFGYNITVYENN